MCVFLFSIKKLVFIDCWIHQRMLCKMEGINFKR